MESNYSIREVMRALLLSDFFRSKAAAFSKVKSPAEHVAGVMRLVEDYTFPKWGIRQIALECRYMGQDLMNPPSVEGWHVGKEWIDTGILVERINFAAEQVSDVTKPGVQRIIERLRAKGDLSAEQFVDATLDLIGPLRVSAPTHKALLDHAAKAGAFKLGGADDQEQQQRVGEMLALIVATREFQLV
jgi:hypothetical protein